MDTDSLVNLAKSRFDHAAAKKLLREKYQARMIFSHQGGMWRAGPELLVLLSCVPGPDAVLQDLYDNPIKVCVADLKTSCQQRWQEQMTAWLVEFDQQQQQR
jgi:hypothetical protein